MLAFSYVHPSIRPQSDSGGIISLTFVFQLNVVKPDGSAVVFFPDAKSTIKIPKALAMKALEQDAIWNSVFHEYK